MKRQNRIVYCRTHRPLTALLVFAAFYAAATEAAADPILPTFGPAIYNIAVANPLINGGIPASTAAADNAAAINAYVTYCSNHGGGTVEIPSGTFRSSTITMLSNVNLQLDASATLRDNAITNTLLKCTSGTNMAISGTGTIDGAATTTVSSANLVDLRGVNILAITGVTICNAAHEHLVPINDNNVTISGITIHDNGTKLANGGNYLANTDAIDYAGNNFLIKNCNINAGDDDIVAKPAGTHVSNVLITNCTIGRGHGISFGGGSAQGVENVLVTNCTLTGTDNGLRLKASDSTSGNAGGGLAHPVTGITFSNITMTNVANPIVIDSFYDNGSNNFPASPTDSTHYPVSPIAIGPNTPIWKNITFDNITITGSSNAGLIYGLKTSPLNLDGLCFNNVNISASSQMNLWYGSNINVSGLTITVPTNNTYANASPVHGAFLSNATLAATVAVIWDGQADGITWNAGTGSVANWKNGAILASTYADPDSVTFDDSAPANARTLSLSYSASPSSITINSSTNTYSLNGSGSIVGPGTLIKNGTGIFTINVPLILTGAITLNAGTLLLSAPGNELSAISGSGNLSLSGTATLRPDAPLARLNSLTLAGSPNNWTGKLDLTNNNLILTTGANSPNQLKQGANLGSWNGQSGIASSRAQSAATGSTATALAYATGAQFTANNGQTQFAGQSFLPTDMLIMYTLAGDANMDANVTFADFLQLQNHYNQPNTDWQGGDFNYDGSTTFADFLILQNNYNKTLSIAPLLPTSATSVPEPATLLLLLLPFLTSGRKRPAR